MSEQITDKLNANIEAKTIEFKSAIKTGSLSLEELKKCFFEYIPTLVETNPFRLYDNPLSRLIIEYIGDGIPGDFLLTFIKVELTNSYKQALSKYCSKYDSMEIKSPADFEDLCRHCSAFQTRVSVLRQAALLREAEPVLWDMAMNEAKKNLEYARLLLGKVIEDPDYIEYANTAFEMYALSSSIINGLNIPKKKDELNGDVMEEFDNPLIARLYQQYYQFWRQVQKDTRYNEAETIAMIKMDEYISCVYPESEYEYQKDNSSTYSPTADCHYNATLLLEGFLMTSCPAIYDQHQEWFDARLNKYKAILGNGQRTFVGTDFVINDLFKMACDAEETTTDNVLGYFAQCSTSDDVLASDKKPKQYGKKAAIAV